MEGMWRQMDAMAGVFKQIESKMVGHGSFCRGLHGSVIGST